jgi:hypothetical protein
MPQLTCLNQRVLVSCLILHDPTSSFGWGPIEAEFYAFPANASLQSFSLHSKQSTVTVGCSKGSVYDIEFVQQ